MVHSLKLFYGSISDFWSSPRSGIYALASQKSNFGKVTNESVTKLTDVNKSELAILAILALLTIGLGFYPNLILNTVDTSVNSLISNYQNNLASVEVNSR